MPLTTGASQDVGTDGASSSLSADGRYLTFNRYSSNATWQTVLRDRTTGADEVVDPDGPNMSAQRSVNPGRSPVSADGRYRAFECWCQRDFAAGYGHLGVYLRDRTAGTTTEVDVSAAGSIVDVPWKGAELGGMSQDGSLVSFASAAPDLVEGDTNAMADVFTRRMHS